uniref:Mce/MlaD domain-containing protein n=1 Tax=Hildenbrandia rubra TaxID=31481 RepID=A0A1C9CG04_9FLOR|nr:hypothetical protein Hrub_084 [Hildenbrandia rubra]AOM67328.1 hypothetical protein Hrub_084 [Hildenbrandia rubra]
MEMYKLAKVVTVFSVHIIWCGIIFVYQLFIIHKSYNTSKPYKLNILFTNVEGIKGGTPVSYRGVNIGKVISINLYTDYVIVSIYIKSSKILIPVNAYVKTYKTIFMADTILHIHNQNIQVFKALKNKVKEKSNRLAKINSFCYNNDFIYGFQGASLDNLIDILIRISIYLDNNDIVDLLYNLANNFNYIITIVKQRLLKSV